MEWFLQQAQTASPLFSVGCLIGIGVLWRVHVKESRTKDKMVEAHTTLATAVAAAIEKGSTTTALAVQEMRDMNNVIQLLRLDVAKLHNNNH